MCADVCVSCLHKSNLNLLCIVLSLTDASEGNYVPLLQIAHRSPPTRPAASRNRTCDPQMRSSGALPPTRTGACTDTREVEPRRDFLPPLPDVKLPDIWTLQVPC